MTAIIRFPSRVLDVFRRRMLSALRFVLDRLHDEERPVKKLFVVYIAGEDETEMFYLNLGFAAEELQRMAKRVAEHESWEDD